MKFVCVVERQDGIGGSWKELYDKPQVSDLASARQWAENTIALFNATLREGENPRKLIDVCATKENAASPHSWAKVNAMTQLGRGGIMFDVMRCSVCRITAKRYGIDSIVRDPDFKAKGFGSCSQSIELLKKRQLLRERKVSA